MIDVYFIFIIYKAYNLRFQIREPGFLDVLKRINVKDGISS